MRDTLNIVNRKQTLERLSRTGSQGTGEIAVVTSPGARNAAWAVKVKSNSSYNVYNVVAVVINDAGSVPTEIGQQTKAVQQHDDGNPNGKRTLQSAVFVQARFSGPE